MASSVASVPELVNRHSGSPKRRASSRGDRDDVGDRLGEVGARRRRARRRPRPAPGGRGRRSSCRTRRAGRRTRCRRRPTRASRAPRSMNTGQGGASCHDDATPPGRWCERFGVELVGAGGPGDQRRLLLRDQGVQGVTGRSRAHHGHEVELSLLTGQSERNRSRVLAPADARPAAGEVGAGDEPHELGDGVLLGGERARPVAAGGDAALHALAGGPVLAVGEVPEVDRERRVEPVVRRRPPVRTATGTRRPCGRASAARCGASSRSRGAG